MCDFCHKHGEGKKWYLEARNFSEDLLSDLKRRQYIERFFGSPEHLAKGDRALTKLDRLPSFLTRGIRRSITERQKVNHFGQVVPIEDVEKILGLTTSVVRLACICRHVTLGPEHRYCYGLSLAPEGGEMVKILKGIDASYLIGPRTGGLEFMSKEQALALMRENEDEGLCHTVWSFVTPFLGGLCNCSLPGCLAMKTTLAHRTPLMFRSEYVARVDDGRCAGCGECAKLCPFDAFVPRKRKAKARVDLSKCYGCGVCRNACVRSAIALADRASVPEAASLWL
ncbi:MAG TPA: 4Fe-4S dicluster domain-containing protein [Terriglobales bacterium]|nr:4Fe-4S dicluster domain-containing protein [Terriglobales bacterium]